MQTCTIETPLGSALITGNHFGISSVTISNETSIEKTTIPPDLKECVKQLQEYFGGRRRSFSLHLNPEGTTFQKTVWKVVQEIPFGKTMSYLQISQTIGNAKAIRAVANANAKNPIWILIPCHRVIGSDGSLTGYAGGLTRKQWLLNHEHSVKQGALF